jgi:Ca-activated chloride channel family protein
MNRLSAVKWRLAGLAAVALVAGCAARGIPARQSSGDRRPGAAEAAPRGWGRPPVGLRESAEDFDELVILAREAPGSAAGLAAGALPAGAGLSVQDGAGIERIAPEHTAVTGQVSAGTAVISVDQRFRNPSGRPGGAAYMMPLPSGAAVTDFVMSVGDRRIRGVIREREDAENIHRQARRQGYLVSLVHARRGWFGVRMGNLAPGAVVGAKTTWFAPLSCLDGQYELTVPSSDPGVAGAGGGFELELALDGGLPIESVETPGQVVKVERRSPARFKLSMKAERPPEGDFVLRYRLAGDSPLAGALVHAEGETRTFSIALQPPGPGAPGSPREIVFAMDGRPAPDVLASCLQQLRQEDRFVLAGCPGLERPLPPDAAALAKAQAAVERMPAGGIGSADGLARVLGQPAEAGRTRSVVLMTDGRSAEKLLPAVRGRPAGTRVYVLAAGETVDLRGTETLAAAGGGQAVVTHPRNIAAAGAELARLLDGPAVTDLRVDWGSIAVKELLPDCPGVLFPGRPLTLVGRAPAGGRHRVVFAGRRGNRPYRQELELDLDDATACNPGVLRLWQLRRLRALEDAELAAPGTAARRSVVEASLSSGLVSRYTELLAVDSLAPAAMPLQPPSP